MISFSKKFESMRTVEYGRWKTSKRKKRNTHQMCGAQAKKMVGSGIIFCKTKYSRVLYRKSNHVYGDRSE